ncbi:MAG: hypothetical protein MUF75_01895 [Bacteroidia bacterium]|jgi:hypothetical protein|nr:hypothetical protein [Bacteroidia bacterium]
MTGPPGIFISLHGKYYKLTGNEPFQQSVNLKVDQLLHWDLFMEFLRRKYRNSLTEKNYLKKVNTTNYELFLSQLSKTKQLLDLNNKRKVLKDQVLLESRGSVYKTKNEINLIDDYHALVEQLNISKIKPGFNKAIYLERFLDIVKLQCTIQNLPFPAILTKGNILKVSPTVSGYEAYIGRTLICYNSHKIHAFLDHQKTIWKGEYPFVQVADAAIYSYVEKNSPFENKERLNILQEWIDIQNGRPRYLTNIKIKSSSPKSKRKPAQSSRYLYWVYPLTYLTQLERALKKALLISSEASLKSVFKEEIGIRGKKIEWKGSLKQLMFLMHLIFLQKPHFKNTPLHLVTFNLFNSTKKSYTSKGLSTILSTVIKDAKSKDTLSNKLEVISALVNELHLPKAFK